MQPTALSELYLYFFYYSQISSKKKKSIQQNLKNKI